jgi:transposase
LTGGSRLKNAAGAAREAGQAAVSRKDRVKHGRYFTDAAKAGIALNAARRTKLQKKRHALATRMPKRAGDYLRFARDLRVPFDNYADAAVMPMSAGSGVPAAGQGGALAA